MGDEKLSVIVLGGTGFIGRNVVQYLVESGKVGSVRAVDKVLPQTAFLGAKHQEAFNHPMVDFRQGNLNSAQSIEKCFTADRASPFDYCFHLASETRYSQNDDVYKEKVVDVATKCAKQALASGVKYFVHVSTAQVYDAGKKPSDESAKLKPWTSQARYMLEAENELRAILGDKLIVLRPCIVYGPGDYTGISPRLICGAVYKHLNETMKFLWTKDLRINTVHVKDVAKAMLHVCQKGLGGKTFNLADKSDTSQGSLNKLIEPIFGIKTDFAGSIQSNMASAIGIKGIAEGVNDKHLKPWSELLRRDNIVNSPLTPYLDAELLYNNSLSIDGSAIEGTGFSYEFPQLSGDALREEIKYFQDQHLFPAF